MGIYVFHQGYAEDGQLWYSYFDGSTWQPDKIVRGVGMSGSPSAVALPSPAGAFSVFHQGKSNNGQLWYSYFDGSTWQPDTIVRGVGMSGSPSAVVIPGDGIYVFHQGFEQDGNLWYSHFHFKNSTWDPDKQVPNVGISDSPSAVVLPGPGIGGGARICVFHNGIGHGAIQIWNKYFDGKMWAPDQQLGIRATEAASSSPGAVVLPGGSISVFHQVDFYQSGQLWHWPNGGTDTQIPNVGMTDSPSAVAFPDGSISVFHQGYNFSGELWYAYFDGATWGDAPDTRVPNVGMSASPSAIIV